jgi:isopenicillin-N epimerase
MMRRRTFIGALGAGGLAACARGAASPGSTTTPTPSSSWAEVKAEFPALAKDLVHMSGFFLASHPRPVRAALEAHRAGLDENPLEYLEEHVVALETGVRAAAGAYLACEPDDLAMTDSTTMGLGIVYGGLELTPGQEILTTTHDHIVTEVALAQRAARGDVPLRKIALYDQPAAADAGEIVARLSKAIGPKTRLVAVTWVHSGTGVKLPIRAMADAVAKANAGRADKDRVLFAVDGVHGFGVEDATIATLGCDFFIAGCHKWIFGPRGTGLVHANRAAWSATRPTIPSMDPFWRPGPPEAMPPAAFMTPGGFHSFEHRWALEPAFRFHLGLGKARVAARIHELNRHMKDELAKLPRVTVLTPRADELSGGIVCFLVEGLAPPEVVKRLRAKRIVASVTPPFYPTPYVRLSAGLINDEADVETALAAVRSL